MRKKECSKWELESGPVWVTIDNIIKPSDYFLKWWQDISIQRYGDDSHWLDIAAELGYLSKETNPKSGNAIYEPIGFDYNPELVRNTLGIPADLPIIRYRENGQSQYRRMLDMLFSTEGGTNDF
jgi:hypothetical protein